MGVSTRYINLPLLQSHNGSSARLTVDKERYTKTLWAVMIAVSIRVLDEE